MRARLFAVFGLLTVSLPITQPASAQVPFEIVPRSMYCGQMVSAMPGKATSVQARISDFHLVSSADLIQQVLNNVAMSARGKCPGDQNVWVQIFALNHAGTLIEGIQGPSGNWVIQQNYVQQIIQQENQAAENKRKADDAATARTQQMAAARELALKQQADFKAQNSIEMWVAPPALKANPFPYKGKIIGIIDVFDQMTGDGEAMFGGNLDLVAYGVPNTLFTRQGLRAVIAVQIEGVKQVQMLGTNMSVPYGAFKAAYVCKFADCSDIAPPQ